MGTDQEEVSRELFLHRSVLDKALIDIFSPKEEIKEEVEDWLDLGNQDFIECCENALLDPELVYATFGAMKQILRGKNARFHKGFNT